MLRWWQVPRQTEISFKVRQATHLSLTDAILLTRHGHPLLGSLLYSDLRFSRPPFPSPARYLRVDEFPDARYRAYAHRLAVRRLAGGGAQAKGYVPTRNLSFQVSAAAPMATLQQVARGIERVGSLRAAGSGSALRPRIFNLQPAAREAKDFPPSSYPQPVKLPPWGLGKGPASVSGVQVPGPGAAGVVFPTLVPAQRYAGWRILSSSSTSTPGPGPTVAATTMPSGDQLLILMQQSMQIAGSVHFETTTLSITKTERVTGTTNEDMSWRRNLLREHDQWKRIELERHPLASTVERRTLLFARQTAASRSSLNHHWYCEQLHGMHVGAGFLPFEIGTPVATDLGPAAMGGVDVWHVRATGVPVNAWALDVAVVDFYIAQTDDTLKAMNIRGTAKVAGKSDTETIEERYSRYGEAVSVRLPTVCRSVGND